MTYDEAIAYIASLAPRGWRLGLDRMQELLNRAGLSGALGRGNSPQFIHIAGTNGKGSVTAFVQSILLSQGYKTGSFYSPFVYDPRERIQVNGEYITKEKLAELTERLKPFAEGLSETEFGGATEFELKTALGFAYWQEAKCDWVALEVGLGGRLDATNVIQSRAAVIVSIGLDHTSILGTKITEIALEKAGIIKPQSPAIVGEMPELARAEIFARAAEAVAPVWLFGTEIVLEQQGSGYRVSTPGATYEGLSPGLEGSKQPHNMALALAAVEAAGALRNPGAVAAGIKAASIPGRLEHRTYKGKQILLDGAHNSDSAIALGEYLRKRYAHCKILLVTGMVAGHDPNQFYGPFASLIFRAFVGPIDFHRTLNAAEVASSLQDLGVNSVCLDSAWAAFDAAVEDAGMEDLVLVTGSFYLVGEVGRGF